MPSFFDLKLTDDYEENLNFFIKWSFSQIQIGLAEGVIGIEVQLKKCMGNLMTDYNYGEVPLFKFILTCKNLTSKLEDLGTIVLISSLVNLHADVQNSVDLKEKPENMFENMFCLLFEQKFEYDGLYVLITSGTFGSIQKLSEKISQFLLHVKKSVKTTPNPKKNDSTHK